MESTYHNYVYVVTTRTLQKEINWVDQTGLFIHQIGQELQKFLHEIYTPHG